MTAVTPYDGDSPFDAIRRTREDGTEYWSARDLMPLLGYVKWQDFQHAIDRSKQSATAAGHDVGALFVQVSQLMGAGNLGQQRRVDFSKGLDWLAGRYAVVSEPPAVSVS